MHASKSQSAMEYLMTYGWAILIIAVVLTILFQLGIFSAGNFQPHAQAGSCQVSRTVAGVSLEGQCNGLLPEFVAKFDGSSTINLGSVSGLSSLNQLTISAWINIPASSSVSWYDIVSRGDWQSGTFDMITRQDGNIQGLSVNNNGNSYQTGSMPTGVWNNVVWTATSSGLSVYINGAFVAESGSTSVPYTNGPYTTIIGGGNSGFDGVFDLVGSLSNIQIYNTSLSKPEITALYLEGIGGAPIRPQNLTGWWPLNGNVNDYSGNGNNGQLNGVTFSSSWESGYTAP